LFQSEGVSCRKMMNLLTQKERVQKWHTELDNEILRLMSNNPTICHAHSASIMEGEIDEVLFLKRAVVLLAKDNEIKTKHFMEVLRKKELELI